MGYRVRVNATYFYQPVGLDLWDPRSDLQPGERVRVVNLPGCPPANTMRMCHVLRLDGSWGGLVLTASLTRAIVRA